MMSLITAAWREQASVLSGYSLGKGSSKSKAKCKELNQIGFCKAILYQHAGRGCGGGILNPQPNCVSWQTNSVKPLQVSKCNSNTAFSTEKNWLFLPTRVAVENESCCSENPLLTSPLTKRCLPRGCGLKTKSRLWLCIHIENHHLVSRLPPPPDSRLCFGTLTLK